MRACFITALAAAATLGLLLVSASAQNTPASDRKAAPGEKLFTEYQCYACHGFSGQNGPGKRLVPMKMAQVAFTAYGAQAAAVCRPTRPR
jgi:mono/diheme cytochrome c family protein